MKTNTLLDVYTGATVVVFVLLTAWGNALAMLVVAALGLVVGLAIFGKKFARATTLAAAAACVIAAVFAFALQHR